MQGLIGLPRTRGDRPDILDYQQDQTRATPYTRGSTWIDNNECLYNAGYPVHAGIDPTTLRQRGGARWLPRTRGDRPYRRGWSKAATRATPYTRGSTHHVGCLPCHTAGYPVHAGIDPNVLRR